MCLITWHWFTLWDGRLIRNPGTGRGYCVSPSQYTRGMYMSLASRVSTKALLPIQFSSAPVCVCAELWLGLRCLVKWPSSLDADTWYKWGVACSTAALYWPWAVWHGIMEHMLGHRNWFKSHVYDLLVGWPWANYLISESVSSYPNWEFPWGLNERTQAKYLVQFQTHNGLLIKGSHEDSPTLRRWDSGLISFSGTREMAYGQ